MNESEYINFLNSYTLSKKTAKLITNSEDINEANVPLYWKEALASSDAERTKKLFWMSGKNIVVKN